MRKPLSPFRNFDDALQSKYQLYLGGNQLYFNDFSGLSLLEKNAIVAKSHFVLDYGLVVRDALFFVEQVEPIDVQLVMASVKVATPKPVVAILLDRLTPEIARFETLNRGRIR